LSGWGSAFIMNKHPEITFQNGIDNTPRAK